MINDTILPFAKFQVESQCLFFFSCHGNVPEVSFTWFSLLLFSRVIATEADSSV